MRTFSWIDLANLIWLMYIVLALDEYDLTYKEIMLKFLSLTLGGNENFVSYNNTVISYNITGLFWPSAYSSISLQRQMNDM